MASIFQKYPVLLCEGLSTPAVNNNVPNLPAPPGVIREATYTIATDRGKVKYLDYMPFEFDVATLTPARVSLLAGGQELLTESVLADYFFAKQLGIMEDHLIKVGLNDAQTILARLDNTASLIPNQIQVQAFYTTDEHEYFLRNFKWKFGLGLKRRTYELIVPPNVVVPPAFNNFFIELTVPRQNGNIIGVSVITTVDPSIAGQYFYTLSINGVETLIDISAFNAVSTCGRRNHLYRIGIQPGAKFRFSVNDFAGGAANQYFYVTFYFDN